ncbi:hypothetical protein [Klebsiella aerogenes]|uniref:hypothetical protein n=1 Tax=Klebsiella aerogenes TaxID=548 RepID=UPI0013A6028A|nr:hypothetical protein [Klebsiella aerogenes]HCB2859817.1 hypothetical protein [Klebsiella aerogenes]HCB2864820.1 hypothetical protein [Klebsiella aerogenes]HCB2880508.1 hypothetical protein [Klebsiella aerogenes]HCB3345883.1 hypothetical protein [Klebsiella aerogenes]HCM1811885.1 hypothetical protein [Klebsiella aerogenes]
MDEGLIEAVRQAQGYFNFYHRYPIERLEADYQYEIRKFSNESWEAPQRAARLSAAVKNYKTSQMLSFINKANDKDASFECRMRKGR